MSPLAAEGVPEELRQWLAAFASNNVPSTTRFALGATLSGSNRMQGALFHAAQGVEVHGYLQPAAADIGKAAALYTIAHVTSNNLNGWYMLTAKGNWIDWQPSEMPTSYKQVPALSALETLPLLSNVHGLVAKFEIYIGYSVDNVRYSIAQPLKFEVVSTLAQVISCRLLRRKAGPQTLCSEKNHCA